VQKLIDRDDSNTLTQRNAGGLVVYKFGRRLLHVTNDTTPTTTTHKGKGKGKARGEGGGRGRGRGKGKGKKSV
jgi:hypothetical protein